jgi:hypothetical protein
MLNIKTKEEKMNRVERIETAEALRGTLTAEQAIDQLNAEKTTFMGNIVPKYDTIEIRAKLRYFLVIGLLSGKEFWRASNITLQKMPKWQIEWEQKILNWTDKL